MALGMYVKVIFLDQCDEPPSFFVLSVCAYGGVVGYFSCFLSLANSSEA